MSTPAANWYPNPDDPTEERYWDGTQWTARVRPLGADPLAEEPAPSAPQRRKRRTPLWVAVTAGVVGLVLGGSGAALNAETRADVERLEQELIAATESAAADAAALDDARAELADVEERLAEQQKTHASEQQKLAQKHSDAEARAKEAEGRAQEATTRAETAEALAAEATQAAEAASAPRSFLSAPPEPTGTTSFRNCTEARNAGAAPVYIGDPGYGPHLDRDGDGVGCE
ncbi:excalibur calcium-binding domain-containing protein [Leucobacter sp. PH1c]|uniref:excalibur calcium-binding domain-containing protein n=1 Tax=Leucobacter sp. PH1c TaxID=1397278 RepID=UPI00046A5A5E|nr:excalibur calcium-binding domain-containing protein [Leucobacter sp. PH1c]